MTLFPGSATLFPGSATLFPGSATLWQVDFRTGWRTSLGWIVGLGAMALLTTVSVTSLYSTAASREAYAANGEAAAVIMVNGRVAGLSTFGGIFANELSLVLAFGYPILAIALCSRFTRGDEAAGRLELLLASPVGRRAPLAAAVSYTSATLLLAAAAVAVTFAAFGAGLGRSLVFGLGLALLGWVFVGVTAVMAQLVAHPRTVWGLSIGVMIMSYLGRGIAATRDSPLIWLSPHGWLNELRAFGDMQLAPALLSLVVGAGLCAVAFGLRSRRDIDGAILATRPGSERATASLLHPVLRAWQQQRGVQVGWMAGLATMMVVYGSIMPTVLDAIADNPDLGELIAVIGLTQDDQLKTVLSSFLMLFCFALSGYVVMALGSTRREEREGRLEMMLSGSEGRGGWLGAHVAVCAIGVVLIGVAGALALGASTAVALGESSWLTIVLRSSIVFVVPAIVFGAMVVAFYGIAPRFTGVVWAIFTGSAIVALLGVNLDLPTWLLTFTPFATLGDNVVKDGADISHVVVSLVVAAALFIVGFVSFGRRDIPSA